MLAAPVGDDEHLYRRLPQGRGLYRSAPDGRIEFSSSLFADREQRAPVDRAMLCEGDPAYTQHDPLDGVVVVVAGDARAIAGLVQYDANRRPVQAFRADVVPDPIPPDNPDGLPSNPAHAVILTNPFPPPKGVYRRLLERLAILARTRDWESPPQELRPTADERP